EGPHAAGHDVGVAVHHLDGIDRNAKSVTDEHGPGRDAALPVRGGARSHHRGAVLADLDGGELAARYAVGDLHVGRQADPVLPDLAGLSPPRLLLAKVGVPGRLQGQLEGAAVVADVVGGPQWRSEWERVRRHQVAAANL